MGRPDLVQIFDPAKPARPVLIVPGDFNPGAGHRRWEFRPTAQPADWLAVLREALDIPAAIDSAEPGDLVDHTQRLDEVEQVAVALERFNLRSIEDLARAGMIAGVNAEFATKLITWARAHPYLPAETVVVPAAEPSKAPEHGLTADNAKKAEQDPPAGGEPEGLEGTGEPEKHQKRPRR